MEQERINDILHYLKTSKLPDNISEARKKYIDKNIHKFTIHKDSVYLFQPQDMYCLKKVLNKKEAEEAFIQYHYHPLGGHFAYANTKNRIAQKFYWESMNKDIFNSIKECIRCQEHGNKTINEKAYPISVPISPFSQLGIDIKHVTPSQTGHRYIIVAIDYLTKYVEARALLVQTSSEIAAFLYEEIIVRHGCPNIIITDNGRPFISELIQIVCKQFGIRTKNISPHNSQANGLVERFNRTIDSILKRRNIEEKKNWPDFLPAAIFAYRSIKQATTGQSPFFLMYGYEPTTFFENSIKPLDIKEASFELQLTIRTSIQIQYLENIRKESWNRIQKSQKVQVARLEKRMNNTKKEIKPPFKVGDVVKVYRDNISTSWSAKISIRWFEDNFCIQEKLKKGSYFIKNITNPEDTKLRLVHGNRMKSFTEPKVNWEKQAKLLYN
jgi:hypothetical protein